jgi:signal transduction histidine kinase
MSDAVWFTDPQLDDVQQLMVRIRAVASATLYASAIAFTVDAPADVLSLRLTLDQRRHLYLVVKEALANVQQHSMASRVAVRVTVVANRLRLEVVDDGVGIAPERLTSGGGYGLVEMQQRAAALDGTLTLGKAMAGSGTRVMLEVPLGV